MEDELEELRWQPEAAQPVSWDSEMSVLVHSAINGIENTLQVRQTRSDQTLFSLANMAKMLKLPHRRKGDRQEWKRSVLRSVFPSLFNKAYNNKVESPISSMHLSTPSLRSYARLDGRECHEATNLHPRKVMGSGGCPCKPL